jgi:hypothetical protein
VASAVLSRLAVVILLMAARPLWADPRSALPADVAVLTRGQTLNINGQQCDIYELRSAKSPAQLAADLSRAWSRDNPRRPLVQRQAGEWLVISRRDATRVQTVQWQAAAGGGSRGFLSELSLDRSPDRPARPLLLLPATVQVRSFVQSRESGATLTQFTAVSTLDAISLLRSLLQSASRTRWLNQSAGIGVLQADLAAGRGASLALSRGTAVLDLVIDRDASGSSLVINQRESGPWQ